MVPAPTAGITTFNYKIGVPALIYAATIYMALLRTGMPWFRSQGQYAPLLRKYADALDTFVMKMQTACLARTHHTPDSIHVQQFYQQPEIPGRGFDPDRTPLSPMTYQVGAFDLVNYSDAHLVQCYGEHSKARTDLGRRGAFDYSWHTSLTDLALIADAANEQALSDYTNLQAMSGVLRLVQPSGQLRWLSTPPIISETVRGRQRASRIIVSETDAEATSPPIFPSGVIASPAALRRYDARSHSVITVQDPGHFAPKSYRVLLRSVDTRKGDAGWQPREYVKDVWRPSYRRTDSDPRNLQLESALDERNPEAFLWELELIAGHPEEETGRAAGEVTFTATTFDWYVPTLSYSGPFVELQTESWDIPAASSTMTTRQKMRSSGGLSIHAWDRSDSAEPVIPKNAPLSNVSSEIWGLGGGIRIPDDFSLARAERRHVKHEQVRLTWELVWTGREIEVSLAGNPDTRPFQVYVVVEERAYSGGTAGDTIQIHTPFQVEIVNQAMLVPERFFKDESDALAYGQKLYDEVNTEYAKQGPLRPGDPIESMLNGVREQLKVSQSTATIAEGLNTRLEFMRNALPEFFEQRVHELGPVKTSTPGLRWVQ